MFRFLYQFSLDSLSQLFPSIFGLAPIFEPFPVRLSIPPLARSVFLSRTAVEGGCRSGCRSRPGWVTRMRVYEKMNSVIKGFFIAINCYESDMYSLNFCLSTHNQPIFTQH